MALTQSLNNLRYINIISVIFLCLLLFFFISILYALPFLAFHTFVLFLLFHSLFCNIALPSYLSFLLPRIRVLLACLFPLAGFAFYFLVSFPFLLFLYLLIPSTHSSLLFLMTNQDFWECILVYCTPGVHKSRTPTRPGDYIFYGSS